MPQKRTLILLSCVVTFLLLNVYRHGLDRLVENDHASDDNKEGFEVYEEIIFPFLSLKP